jgi:hypothetical protein
MGAIRDLLVCSTVICHHGTLHDLLQIIAGNTNSDQPEEQEWEARKERMAQMEAILMSAINHPNIVRTYKVGWWAHDCAWLLITLGLLHWGASGSCVPQQGPSQ